MRNASPTLSPPTQRRVQIAALASVLAMLLSPSAALAQPAAGPIDLAGTWHVLIHYTDDNSSRPEKLRWDDRVWVFSASSRGLQWTEYPIVVFRDSTGRFTNLGTNLARRVAEAWVPNEKQASQIRTGLEINTRGTTEKKLRQTTAGSGGWGWQTRNRSSGGRGLNVMSYQKTWIIEGSADAPIFRQEDGLSSNDSGAMDGGLTQYATTQIARHGNEIHGTFERDGTRHGTFVMTRAGEVRGVKGSGKSQNERFREIGLAMLRGSVDDEAPPVIESDEPAVLPSRGMTLQQVLAALRQPPNDQHHSTLRKLEVVLLDGPEVTSIPEDALKAASGEQFAAGSFGVIALTSCDAEIGRRAEFTSWYLVEANALSSWSHFVLNEGCSYAPNFKPASAKHIASEARLVARAESSFPRNQEHDLSLYARALEFLVVGRVDDARRMLAEADANVDVDKRQPRRSARDNRLANLPDPDAVRAQLVEAIAAADAAAEAAPTN